MILRPFTSDSNSAQLPSHQPSVAPGDGRTAAGLTGGGPGLAAALAVLARYRVNPKQTSNQTST